MRAALRPCITHGCTNYALAGKSRCSAHERQHARERWNQGLTGKRGSRPGWRKVRAVILERQRLNRQLVRCAHCRHAFTAGEIEVHHKDGDAHNDDPANLSGLCRDCHRKATT